MTEDITTYRGRLAELVAKRDQLVARRDDLASMLAQGPGGPAVEAAARALIAGNGTAVAIDPAAELRQVTADLEVNGTACSIVSGMVGLLELREGYKAALPAFERAMAHVATRAKLLDALEREFREADADLAEFDRISGTIAGLAAQHPTERAPYAEAQLELLRYWFGDFKNDGVNPTGVQRWRARAAELGVSLEARP